MATNSRKHISVPKTFSLGDVDEWFCHFEICCKTNEWNGATKAAKLPTLLEGEALAVWIKLSEEDKEDCGKAKKVIKSKLLPTTFMALEKFNGRLMLPSEKLPLFLHDLKRLLDLAMPGLTNKAREQLLLHQFLTGLPSAISKQLCSLGDKKAPDMTVERTQLLISIEKDHEQKGVAPISQEDRGSKLSEVTELKTQLIKLSEQVAALAAVQLSKRQSRMPRCFICNGIGHFQQQCPSKCVFEPETGTRRCFCCGQLGHLKKDCKMQGNDQGTSRAGHRRPAQ